MSDIQIILTEALRENYRQLPEHIHGKFDKQMRFLLKSPGIPHCAFIVWMITGSSAWTSIIAVSSSRQGKPIPSSTWKGMRL